MTSKTKKWVHAGVAALVSGTISILEQMASGHLVSAPRAVIVGTIGGVLMRAAGAALAALATTDISTKE